MYVPYRQVQSVATVFVFQYFLPQFLVHSGCCNKNTTHPVASAIFVSRRSRGQVQERGTSPLGVWWESLPWILDGTFSWCPLMVGGARERSGAAFVRTLIPFGRAPPSRPLHLPRTPPPNTITLGIRFPYIWILRGYRHPACRTQDRYSISVGFEEIADNLKYFNRATV